MNASIWLTAGLLALVTGPLIHALMRSRKVALAGLDGFSCTAVAGLVLLHGLPEAFDRARWWSLLAALIGFFGPSMFERWRQRTAYRAHATAVGLALIGLTIHSFIDGSVLGLGNDALALAVVLHRVPESLAIWMLLFRRRAIFMRSLTLSVMALATVVGFGLGSILLASGLWLGLVGGLVSGSLLHVVFHRPAIASSADSQTRQWARPAAALGALLGLALVAGAHSLDAHHANDPGLDELSETAWGFLQLAADSAPALLLAYLGAGLLDVFMPRGAVSWLRRGSALSQALRGVGFGLPLPICSCGVIPLYRSLVLSGTPATASLAFLVATPEIGIDAILLSMKLLGVRLTLARLSCAAVVAIASGWLVGRWVERSAVATALRPEDPSHRPIRPVPHEAWLERIRAVLRAGFGEVVDNTAPWILLGLGLAALGARLIDPNYFATLPVPASVVLFALAGIPTYVCAAGATPLAAMLISRGLSPGAALAFMLTGPATNATTFSALSQLHGPRTALGFGLSVTGLAIALGLAVNALVPHPEVVSLNSVGYVEHPGMLQLISVGLLGSIYLASLFRQGPRTFLSRIFKLDTSLDAHPAAHSSSREDPAHPQHSDMDSDPCSHTSCC